MLCIIKPSYGGLFCCKLQVHPFDRFTLFPPSCSSTNKCLLVSSFWTRSHPQHLVSVAYLFSTTAGLTLASFVLGLVVLRELTLSPFP